MQRVESKNNLLQKSDYQCEPTLINYLIHYEIAFSKITNIDVLENRNLT